MQRRLVFCLLLAVAPSGCAESPPPPALSVAPVELAESFDRTQTGTITGSVLWQGEIPSVPTFRSVPEPFSDQPAPPARDYANPNAPDIDPATRAVRSAVVFLRHVDARRCRAWDHPAPRVELRDQRVHILQGDRDGIVGFVRVGDCIDILSRDSRFHSLQGRGASFFSRALLRADEIHSRRLLSPGLVELRSGAGYYWMRGYLFVGSHPYYTHVDASGKFTLADVPAGEYDLVVWHPDWRVVRQERNPDSARIQQVYFGKPIEVVRRVRVTPQKTARVPVALSVR